MDTGPSAMAQAVDAADGQQHLPGAKARAWHTLSVRDVATSLQADVARGLTDAEAARRRKQFGPNALAEAKGRSPFRSFGTSSRA